MICRVRVDPTVRTRSPTIERFGVLMDRKYREFARVSFEFPHYEKSKIGSTTGLIRFRAWLLTVLFFALATASPTRAEIHQQGGGWLIAGATGSFEAVSPKLSRVRWWFDFQARFFENTNGLGQTIVRPALGWALTESASVWLGYGWVRDLPANHSTIDENRIWQQFLWNGAAGRWSLQSRTRLEQRFVSTGSDVGWRLRQLVKILYPLLASDRLRFAAYDEVFVAFNSTDWGALAGFDQNRLFLGFNVPIDSARRIQAEFGYLNRYARRPALLPGRMDHLGVVSLMLSY